MNDRQDAALAHFRASAERQRGTKILDEPAPSREAALRKELRAAYSAIEGLCGVIEEMSETLEARESGMKALSERLRRVEMHTMVIG